MSSWYKSGKSKGVLAFANNTETVDYLSIAQKSLKLAEHHLGIPSKIITNTPPSDWRNSRLDTDTGQLVTWNNYGRYQAYEASPWDETLVIDIDYLITTDKLLSLFDQSQDLMLCHHNNMLGQQAWTGIELQPVWATVFFFRKSQLSKTFFDLVGRIQRNWTYYLSVFCCPDFKFRNDYAFAMAEIILNAHEQRNRFHMPLHINTVDQAVTKIDINREWMVVRCEKQAHVLPRSDLHVMSKQWLMSNSFDDFITGACA